MQSRMAWNCVDDSRNRRGLCAYSEQHCSFDIFDKQICFGYNYTLYCLCEDTCRANIPGAASAAAAPGWWEELQTFQVSYLYISFASCSADQKILVWRLRGGGSIYVSVQ